ncbi:MAG: hypothetical protein AB7S72_03700 [Draconibacterium sp.]
MNLQTAISLKIRLSEKKYFASRIACSVFIAALVFYLIGGRTAATTFIATGAMLLFTTQFVFQFKWLNLILGISALLVSIYFLMAVTSEFSEFETATAAAWQLLLVGGGIFLAGIVLSVSMLVSCFKD